MPAANLGRLGTQAIKLNQSSIFPLDAANEYLSYSKMKYETNVRHVKQVSENKMTKQREYVNFDCCKTNTGWFGCNARKK